MKILREEIRRKRELSGLSIRALAEEAGISKSSLAYIETGQRGGSERTAKKLALALDVPMEDIIK